MVSQFVIWPLPVSFLNFPLPRIESIVFKFNNYTRLQIDIILGRIKIIPIIFYMYLIYFVNYFALITDYVRIALRAY